MNLKTIIATATALMLASTVNAQSVQPEPHAATITEISNQSATGGAKYTFECPSCPEPHSVMVWIAREPEGVAVGNSVVLWDDAGVEGLKLMHIEWNQK